MRIWRWAVVLASGVSAVLAMGCSAPQPAGDGQEGPVRDGAVRIVAEDAFFRPDLIELEPHESVTLEVANRGDFPHDFTIEQSNLSTGVIQPGAVKTLTFEVPGGRTVFVCKLHGGMDGTIVAPRANEG